MDIRIGQGFDSHRLVAGRPLILAGVRIPFELGLDGVSDADVVVHAIIDALLGAMGAGNIGEMFPENTSRGAVSIEMLKKTAAGMTSAGYELSNLDVTVIAESPRLSPYVADMRSNLALAMNVSGTRISIKPKTNEKMGFLGRGEGIAAICSALIYKPAPPKAERIGYPWTKRPRTLN